MKTANASPSTNPSRLLRQGLALSCLLTLVVLSAGCFRIGADAGAMRDAVQKAATSGGAWEKQIEISVGAGSFALARSVGALADFEPEARAVLQAARGVEVGVYQYRGQGAAPRPAALISSTTAAMKSRGWDRILAVADGRDTVIVFVADDSTAGDPVRLCLLVFDGSELVVASMRADLEPLARLALASRDRGLLASR